jgi:hypothetical protein
MGPIPVAKPPAPPTHLVATLVEDTFVAVHPGRCENLRCRGKALIAVGQRTIRDIHGSYFHEACVHPNPWAVTPVYVETRTQDEAARRTA